MTAPILPGAEPFSAAGGPDGVLVVHGFTGNPQSMRPLAQAFAAAGFTVELPLLPGHGTSLDDMLETTWDDWSAAAEAAYAELAGRCQKVVVAGLSMGGTLTLWLASRHPEIAGIVCINAAAEPPGQAMIDMMQMTLDQGTAVAPAIGNDVADPDSTELAYDGLPVAQLLSLLHAQVELGPRISSIQCPALVLTSRQDHVVPPSSSEWLVANIGGPVEHVWLEKSFHVATIDYDADEIFQRATEFAAKVTAG